MTEYTPTPLMSKMAECRSKIGRRATEAIVAKFSKDGTLPGVAEADRAACMAAFESAAKHPPIMTQANRAGFPVAMDQAAPAKRPTLQSIADRAYGKSPIEAVDSLDEKAIWANWNSSDRVAPDRTKG